MLAGMLPQMGMQSGAGPSGLHARHAPPHLVAAQMNQAAAAAAAAAAVAASGAGPASGNAPAPQHHGPPHLYGMLPMPPIPQQPVQLPPPESAAMSNIAAHSGAATPAQRLPAQGGRQAEDSSAHALNSDGPGACEGAVAASAGPISSAPVPNSTSLPGQQSSNAMQQPGLPYPMGYGVQPTGAMPGGLLGGKGMMGPHMMAYGGYGPYWMPPELLDSRHDSMLRPPAA